MPRFFPSFEAVLGEILQNAHRSGATEVRVVRNAQNNTITFIDNGSGLDNPERLLKVGDVGWDESIVIDPAGMGAFATLRSEFVRRVTRKKYSAEEKVRIVLEGLHGETSVAALCRREGIP